MIKQLAAPLRPEAIKLLPLASFATYIVETRKSLHIEKLLNVLMTLVNVNGINLQLRDQLRAL